VLRLIGAGGMGQVYAAYDPKLDRKVALKLLHSERDADGSPRLVREAKALARLSHPNIVTVHEVGVHEQRRYIAMEFVEGTTLREWLRQHPPDGEARQQEALELLIQAGEGLAAVHAAGLIHRDFKPGNILVGNDGRARVADFGIVSIDDRAPASGEEMQPEFDAIHATEDDEDPHDTARLGEGSLTRSGAVLGTPAYMAPEQFRGVPALATADQYAFCVTAWEVLFGRRPFAAETSSGMLDAIRAGDPAKPEGGTCPDRLESALRRGLSFSPRRRPSGMQSLLDELRAAAAALRGQTSLVPKPDRTVWIYVAAGAVVAAGATWAATRDGAQPCTGSAQGLTGIWDGETRTRLEQKFSAQKDSFAPEVWTSFERELDDYANAWMIGHRDACEAAQVRKEQSVAVMDLRMACLDDRRRDLEALVDVYSAPDRTALASSQEAVAGLRPVGECTDVDYVQKRGKIPQTGEAGERAQAVLAKVSRAKALSKAGQLTDAKALVAEAVADAELLEVDAVLARALLQSGSVRLNLHEGQDARDDLERAYLLSTHGEDVAFDASVMLIQVEGLIRQRHETARTWERVARSEAPSVEQWRKLASLHTAVGRLRQVEGRISEAQDNFVQAREFLTGKVDPASISYARATVDLAGILALRGDPRGAVTMLRTSLRDAESSLGPTHPGLARFHRVLAHAYASAGSFEDGLHHAEQAVRLDEAAYGPNHTRLSASLRTLAQALWNVEDDERAFEVLDRAQALSVPGPLDDSAIADLLALESSILVARHNPGDAEPKLRRALQLVTHALGDLHPKTIRTRVELGTALTMLGRQREGAILVESSAALATTLGAESPMLAQLYDGIGEYWELSGDMGQAAEYSEKALKIFKAAFGADNHQVLLPHGNLCGQLGHLGRIQAALVHCQRALDLASLAGYGDGFSLGDVENNFGAALARAGRWEDAEGHYEKALEVWRDTLPAHDIRVAIVLSNLAECDAALGRSFRAQRRYSESLQLRERAAGPAHPIVITPLVALVHLLIARGDDDEAVPLAKRAVDVATSAGTPLDLARSREALARALFHRRGRMRESARLAKLAKKTYTDLGPVAKPDLERLEEWVDNGDKQPG